MPSLPANGLSRTPSPLDFNPKAFSTDAPANAESRRSPVSPLPSSPSGSNERSRVKELSGYAQRHANRQSIPFTYQDQQQAQFPQYPTMMPLNQRSASTTTRPVSAMYVQPPQPLNGDHTSRDGQSRPQRQSSRQSILGMPQRSSSRTAATNTQAGVPTRVDLSARAAATAMQAGVPIQEDAHTERSYKQNPAYGGAAPPRKSSRGMVAGQAVNASKTSYVDQHQDRGDPHTLDGPLESSEEWKEKGAAVGVRQEIDANGKIVRKEIKKGVKDFNYGRTLGEGSYSTVVCATDRQTGKDYAVKILDKRHIIKEKKVKYVNIEKDALNRLTDHPGVVRLYYTFQDQQSLFFVLDLASNGELLGVLKRTTTFNEECTRFYGAEILDTIDYMHARGVIHRDLKPENVLLDDHMHVKITDFGTAKMIELPKRLPQGVSTGAPEAGNLLDGSESNSANSFVGTAEYVSPELLTDKNACKASDLWAFGCIIYQLLAGRPPFKASNEYLTFQKIVALDYKFPTGFPAGAKDLIERLLVLDPASRLSIEHIKNHEFFDGIAWGRGLWRQKPPKLKAFVPKPAETIKLDSEPNGVGSSFPPNIAPAHSTSAKRFEEPGSITRRPGPRVITDLPPPSQLDIEWSPVLTKTNERILKLGNLLVNTTPGVPSPHGRNGAQSGDSDAPKKLSRFFGGGKDTKKRQRLVMVTSSARIIIVAAGGEEKKSKIEIPLLIAGCTWNKLQDSKGLSYWSVDCVSSPFVCHNKY